jgi:hypothetical protein
MIIDDFEAGRIAICGLNCFRENLARNPYRKDFGGRLHSLARYLHEGLAVDLECHFLPIRDSRCN